MIPATRLAEIEAREFSFGLTLAENRELCRGYRASLTCELELVDALMESDSLKVALSAVTAERDALRAAFDDLLSWFPDKPSQPEWRIKAGEHGADDALDAGRALLAGTAQGAE